jgi:hypothetical protein
MSSVSLEINSSLGASSSSTTSGLGLRLVIIISSLL